MTRTPIEIKTKNLISRAFLFASTICLSLSSLSTQAQPTNDNPCSASQVVCGEYYPGSTYSATDSGLPYPEYSLPYLSTNDVFYKFTAYPNIMYTAVVESYDVNDFDAVLSAYVGDCTGSLTEI